MISPGWIADLSRARWRSLVLLAAVLAIFVGGFVGWSRWRVRGLDYRQAERRALEMRTSIERLLLSDAQLPNVQDLLRMDVRRLATLEKQLIERCRILEELEQQLPESTVVAATLASALDCRGVLLSIRGDTVEEALVCFSASRLRWERLLERERHDSHRIGLATTLLHQASLRGSYSADDLLAARRLLAERDERSELDQRILASICLEQARLARESSQDRPAVRKAFEEAVQIWSGMNRSEISAQDESVWIEAHVGLASLCILDGDEQQAHALAMKAVPVAEQRSRDHPTELARLAELYHVLLRLQTKPRDIVAWATRIIETVQRTSAPGPLRAVLVDAYAQRARSYEQLSEYARAIRDHDDILALLQSEGGGSRILHFRARARCERALGRYREAAKDHEAAAVLSGERDRWKDLLDGAEAHALAGEVVRARNAALRLELAPDLGGLEAMLQLERIYALHSERFGADPAVRRANDERTLFVLSRALGMLPVGARKERRQLHERRGRVQARLRRWTAAAHDWEQVVRLEATESDSARRVWNRHELALLWCNADQPMRGFQTLQEINEIHLVPDAALPALAECWARLANSEALKPGDQERAAQRALDCLRETTRRGPALNRASLQAIDRGSLYAPIRQLREFSHWREQVEQGRAEKR